MWRTTDDAVKSQTQTVADNVLEIDEPALSHEQTDTLSKSRGGSSM
jgi:hypothetical protein